MDTIVAAATPPGVGGVGIVRVSGPEAEGIALEMLGSLPGFFPAGLVLYWVTNTVLSIAQQWKINKVVEAESKQQKGGKKPDKN